VVLIRKNKSTKKESASVVEHLEEMRHAQTIITGKYE
jgi:hypothetical protein